MKAAIIAVGREILTGKTLDTNSHWLAGELSAIGVRVKRVVAVDDVLDEISQELTYTLSLGVDVLITTGGLGPTRDDITLEAWTKVLNRDLVLDPRALEMVRAKYMTLKEKGYVDTDEISPEREKMARVPMGSEPLPNPVGAAPGVYMEHEGKMFFSLPGVPSEMKAIFQECVGPRIRGVLASRGEEIVTLSRTIKSGFRDESLLGPIVREVMESDKGVYLKTLATRFGPDVDLEVRVEAWGKRKEEAEERLRHAVKALKMRLKEALDARD